MRRVGVLVLTAIGMWVMVTLSSMAMGALALGAVYAVAGILGL